MTSNNLHCSGLHDVNGLWMSLIVYVELRSLVVTVKHRPTYDSNHHTRH